MADDIVTRLNALASDYKTSEFEFVYADYETVCEASSEIERLRYELAQANNAIKLLIAIETAGRQEVGGD